MGGGGGNERASHWPQYLRLSLGVSVFGCRDAGCLQGGWNLETTLAKLAKFARPSVESYT